MPRELSRATKPPSPHRQIRIRPLYVVLALFLGLFAFKFIEKAQEIRGLSAQAAALRQENQVTAQQNADYRRAIAYYKTNGYIEDAARSLLGYSKPGDVPIQASPIHPVYKPAPMAVPRVLTVPPPAWKQWWAVFFG